MYRIEPKFKGLVVLRPLVTKSKKPPWAVKLEAPVPCKSCYSVSQREFPAEINIHFPGLRNLEKRTVWAFPKLLVCLNCGFTEFVMGNRERERLRDESSEAEFRDKSSESGGDGDLFGT